MQIDDANEGELYDGNDKRIDKKSSLNNNDDLNSKINKLKATTSSVSSQSKSRNTEYSNKNNESASLNLLKQLKLDETGSNEESKEKIRNEIVKPSMKKVIDEDDEKERLKQVERRPFELKPKSKLANSNSDLQQQTAMTNINSKEYTLTNIDFETAKDLRMILFGNLNQCFCDEWKIQNFGFCDIAKLKFGIVQKKGGPCGVLASVQTYILYELIFGQENLNGEPPKDLNLM